MKYFPSIITALLFLLSFSKTIAGTDVTLNSSDYKVSRLREISPAEYKERIDKALAAYSLPRLCKSTNELSFCLEWVEDSWINDHVLNWEKMPAPVKLLTAHHTTRIKFKSSNLSQEKEKENALALYQCVNSISDVMHMIKGAIRIPQDGNRIKDIFIACIVASIQVNQQ